MKTRTFTIILLLVVAVTVAVTCAGKLYFRGTRDTDGVQVKNTPPTLYLDLAYLENTAKPVLELGQLRWKQKAEGRIVFGNSGHVGIKIEKLHASCGCVVVDHSCEGRTIEPKGLASVVLGFDALVRSGSIRYTLAVAYRIQGQTDQRVSEVAYLHATIVPNYESKPPFLECGRLKGDEKPLQRIIHFHPALNKKVRIQGIRVTHPSLSVENPMMTGGDVDILVSFDPGKHGVGPVSAAVEIATDDPIQPKNVVPVLGEILSELYASPNRILLAPGYHGNAGTDVVIAWRDEEKKLEVVSVQSSITVLEVSVRPSKVKNKTTIHIQLASDAMSRRLTMDANIEIRVKGADVPIRVPVLFVRPGTVPASEPYKL